jgi:lysozyme family protein
MANYKISEGITGLNEGGYANNKKDRGKETFAGVSRLYWPSWRGFEYIDRFKAEYARAKTKMSLAAWINASAKATPELTLLISGFYKQNFWNVNQLDYINDQQLANTIYDFGVNSGTSRAADYLQDAYNNLRGTGKALKNDSDIGPTTIGAVNAFPARLLHAEYNRLRESFYRSLAEDPTQADFLNGWLKRLKAYK